MCDMTQYIVGAFLIGIGICYVILLIKGKIK